MALTWRGRRQLMYYAVGGVVSLFMLVALWLIFFNIPSDCFNNARDGTELGVDCGGSCALICRDDARAPLVLWSRSFRTGPQTYTAMAYIQNQNVGAGARAVRYSFQLFDANNILVTDREGVADLPPVQTIPLVESGINVGNRSVARTLFAFADVPVWYRISGDEFPTLRIAQQRLEADGSRITASIINDTARRVEEVTVIAILFDAQGIALATSQSVIPAIARKSSEPVVFTWPGGVPGVARAEITVIPPF